MIIANTKNKGALAAGKIPGASVWSTGGAALSIQTTEPPFLLWDLKLPYAFQESAQSLEIVSSSANDTAAGTGARAVYIETIDGNWNEQIHVIALNGTTPVALPGVHLHTNRIFAVSTGSGHVNAGNITLRIVSSGVVQGYVAAGLVFQRAFKQTTPAGKILVPDNIYFNAGNTGGSNIVVTMDFKIRLTDGTLLTGGTNFFSGSGGPLSITLPTGFVIPEKSTFYYEVTSVSANNANMVISGSGGIYTPSRMTRFPD